MLRCFSALLEVSPRSHTVNKVLNQPVNPGPGIYNKPGAITHDRQGGAIPDD